MKKLLVTILALIYLTSTTGATIHMHYCMGKMYAVDLVREDGCSKCGMKAHEGCCTDESKVLKVKDNHQLVSNGINLNPTIAILLPKYSISNPVLNGVAITLATHNNSPPYISGTSLCILHSVFRI